MSVDNRTEINDCDAVTGWVGDGSPSVTTLTGQFYQGTGSIEAQHSDADEEAYTTEDSLNGGTFSLDWSDSTLYLLVKDNLVDTAANGGIQFIIGDGTNRIGYDVGGNDAVGMPLIPFFNCYKLDVSNRPASFTTQAGSEASLSTTAITQVGYGSLHLAKAQGNVANVFIDYISYIANDSYALTINGGTSGTPETMADVQGDDVTSGWGMVANPLGNQYIFFAPTEWGEAVASADHYFEASNEQWFWVGDNGGGHAVGATHFPFRVIGNATDTGSFVISNVVIVNTGTRSEFDCSSSNVDTLEIDGCTITALASFSAPSSGGTSRFCTNTIFTGCGAITHNGASMNGSSVINSTVAADASSLIYNVAADPNGEMDNMSFTKGTNAHHAIEFGTSSPTTMTLTGVDFSGFNAANSQNDSTFFFARTTGSVTLNLSNVSGNVSYKSAGASITINQSVPISVSGVTEGTRCVMIGDGGAEDGNILLQGYADSTGTVSGSFGGTTPQNVIINARNSGIVNAAILDDASVFTDYTDDAREQVGANDVTLSTSNSQVNDAFYFGGIEQFAEILINISTATTTQVVAWEYWDGGTWSALSNVTDGTDSFKTSGWQKVNFSIPGDWATRTVNSQGPYYYVRARVTTGSGATAAQAEYITLNKTTKYQPFRGTGTIVSGTGLSVNAVWIVDNNVDQS